MLSELETGLIDLVKRSPLGNRLRQVESLPDLEGDSLVGRFVSSAPAVYVALGSFPLKGGYARPKFGVACIAANSRGHQAARHGDGIQIGLHEMLESVMVLLDGATIHYGTVDDPGSASFEVVSCDLVSSEALYQKGVYAGVVQIQTTGEIRLPEVLVDLADFKTFHADYDVDPHQAATEHGKWLQEPADHSTSAPELSDTIVLQE